MNQLPEEILIQIIHYSAPAPHPDAYELPATTLSTLLHLSLVNRVFRRLVEPLIYTRVSITPRKLFRFTRVVVCQTRSRKDHYEPSAMGLHVRSLALRHFKEQPTLTQIKNIASIFYALSGTLERLYMDVFLRQVDYSSPLDNDPSYSLCGATRGLSNLREFCSVESLPWNLDPMPWSSAPTLKRLAVLALSLHYKLTDAMTTLKNVEELAIVFPSLHGTQVTGAPFERIFEYSPGIQNLRLVTAEHPMYSRGFQGLVGEIMEGLTDAQERNKIKVVEVGGVSPLQPPDRERWFAQKVISGEFWSIGPQKLWEDYMQGRG